MMDEHQSAAAPKSDALRMDAQQLIESLRSLRNVEHDNAYWLRLCVCLSQLCRAQAVTVWRARVGASWQLLGTNAASSSELVDSAPLLLAELAPRALAQGYAYAPNQTGLLTAAVRLLDPAGPTVALLVIGARERTAINELMLRAQLVADLPAAAIGTTQVSAAGPAADSLVDLLDLVARVMQEGEFGAATLSLVNLLSVVLRCDQVVLGWCLDGEVRVLAISHIDRFEHKSENVQLLEAAMEEAVDQHQDIVYPPCEGSHNVVISHDRLSRVMGYGHLTTLVFRDEESADAPQLTLLLGRRESGFAPDRLHQVSVALHLLKPWLIALRERSQWWGARWLVQMRRRANAWLSPERPGRKLIGVGATLLLMVLVFGTWPYRIEAPGELSTNSIQVISAPFDGYLGKVHANLGDLVQSGFVLAELDLRDLSLQAADLQSEVRRYEAEADRARAAGQVAETQIAIARTAQAQARMERVMFQINQAGIQAPFTGVVVEGERKELGGVPVRQGDKLFRLARIEGLYAIIHVSERDVRELPAAATGRLRLLSQPGRSFGFQVEKIVPMAQVKGGQGGQFQVNVRLDDAAESWWRPGMTGLALIEAGDRPILWIWTHKLVDLLRMTFWL